MDYNVFTTDPQRPAQSFHPICKRVFVLVLLLSVPILATLARNNWYLPPSNSGHYLTVASKTKVASGFAGLVGVLTPDVAMLSLPEPQTRRIRLPESWAAVSLMNLPVCLRRRPPPAFSA